MSFSIPFSELTPEDKSLIRKECTIKKYCEPRWEVRTCFIRSKITGQVYVPIDKWKLFYDKFPKSQEDYPQIKICFKGNLFTLETDPRSFRDQKTLVDDAITCLSEHHSVFLWLSTGYGKTICAIYLSVWSKVKTVVLAFNQIIRKQWKEKFEIFTDAKLQYLKNSKEKLDPQADVYIIGFKMATKMDRTCFVDIGTVIVDEAHLSTESCFCEALLKFEPLYLIGATATPRRRDGFHKIFEPYFGPQKRFIFREERNKDHTVIKYCTNYKPRIDYITYGGKTRLKWAELKNSLAYNPKRQCEIVNIIRNHPKEKIIVLTDRTQEAEAIFEMIGKKEAELLVGTKQKYDKTKRVLIAGMKKGGIGLDNPELTMLILVTSTRNVKQFEGRLRKNKCLIYDFVDDHHILENQWKVRRLWYERRGASIQIGGSRVCNSSRGSSKRYLKRNDCSA